MGRPRKTESAVCQVCGYDFSGSGSYRYANMRRHIKSKHPNVPVGGTTTINNNNNLFITADTVGNVLTPGLIAAMLERAASASGHAVLPLFGALHCNHNHPERYIAAIPNVSRNRMVVRSASGSTEVLSKSEGAQKVLDMVFENDVPVVAHHVENKYLKGVISSERYGDGILDAMIRYMETISREDRVCILNRLSKLCLDGSDDGSVSTVV